LPLLALFIKYLTPQEFNWVRWSLIMEALPLVSLAGSIAGGSASAANAQEVGNAQAEADYYNEEVANQNALAAQQAAAANAAQQQTKNNVQMGALVSGMAANGGVVNSGTNAQLQDNQTAQGSLAKQNIIYQGNVQAWNFHNQATMDNFAGQQAIAAGQNTANSTMMTSAFQGIGGAAKMFGQQSMYGSGGSQDGGGTFGSVDFGGSSGGFGGFSD
jgi:hypothetical protein